MFWQTVKRGFGYGLGGRIGWELGGLLWGALRKLIAIIALAVGATWGLPMISDSVGTYQQVKQKIEKAQGKEDDHAGQH